VNFFDAQDHARRATRWLVLVYVVATLLIVLGVTLVVGFALFGTSADGYRYSFAEMFAANAGPLWVTAGGTALFIVGSSLYKISILAAGGGRVAQDMGGSLVPADVQDPLRRRLRNVIEEMAIASGVPVPDIYVLEEETGINAFAAGYAPGDAAVAVTRGSLELLDRDELQGVIAHEFSHILNGDMRLNVRMMGVLFGILVLGLMGRIIIRGGYHSSLLSSRRGRGAPAVVIIGLGLAVLGSVGVLFARIIKAAVSRRREYLADASAVQFTRQTRGIANALKKIGGYSEHSYLRAADPEEVSHMLFGSGARFAGLFATHPPLGDRIRALDPSFREADYPDVGRRPIYDGAREEAVSPVAAAAAPAASAADLPAALAESAGRPTAAHVSLAQQIRQSVPARLYDAAHSAELALLLAVALIVDPRGPASDRQLRIVSEQLGVERTRIVRELYGEVTAMRPGLRLPLLQIAFPALKLRPATQLEFLVSLTGRLIDVDGEVDLYEYCYYRVMRCQLGHAVGAGHWTGGRRLSRRELRRAAIELLTVLAEYGSSDPARAAGAFGAGKAYFGNWAEEHTYSPRGGDSLRLLDHSLDLLAALNGKGRRVMLQAVTAVAAFDRDITVAEAELIRTICASLDVPLPPLLTPAAATDM